MYAQVIIDLVHENLAKAFTYLIPDNMNLQIGMRVRVPFGTRKLMGVVVDVSNYCDVPVNKLKPIIACLEDYPAILPSLIELAKDMAHDAHCPLAETLRLMMPAEMRTGKIQIKQETVAVINKKYSYDDIKAAANAQGRSEKRKQLLNLLIDKKVHSLKELSELISSPLQALLQLEEQGHVKVFKQEVFRLPYDNFDDEILPAPELMPQQVNALNIMMPELIQGKGAFLIHGITGSGKTEVYLRMIQQVLDMDKGVIMLVPEISLTPQMVKWFRERFADSAAVLHSRLTAGERYDEWRRIRLGQARVVIGARSAIFAPVENLGLVVIDEEHESTYQSDRHPRYDARHVAKIRCDREGATLVLSSATPSILSFAMAIKGHYTIVEMPKRVMNRPLPTVNIVDMRNELSGGNRSIFSRTLQQKLKICFDTGGQAILFLNRRGYSSFVSCRNCGHVMKCDNCDVSLTHHKAQGNDPESLHCHLCGSKEPVPEKCPECGSPYIKHFGLGTQRVEEEVKKFFPNIETVRMDIDTTTKKNSHADILEEFGSGKARVLIGTQMITKGLDFPNVTLVGVVAADLTLYLPDYRAPERTFQLITQVAGRAGRAGIPGEVVVQTYKPDHPVILDAAKQDYRAFFTRELDRRRTGLYPPYTQLIRLLLEGKNQNDVMSLCESMHKQVKEFIAENKIVKQKVLIVHMDEAPVNRIRGKFRYQVMLKTFVHSDVEPLLAKLEELSQIQIEDINIYLEVNPTNMI